MNNTELVTIPDLQQLAKEIEYCHRQAKTHATITIIYALRCGFYCHHAKAQLPHGQFQKWAEENITGITKKTRENYMNLYIKLKSETVSLLKNDDLKNAPSAFLDLIESPGFMAQIQDPDWIAKLSNQVLEIFNGASITELYSQYGIIKRNKQLELGTNNPEGANGWDTRRHNQQPDQLEFMSRLQWFGSDEEGQTTPDSIMGKIMQQIDPRAKEPSWIHLSILERRKLHANLGDLRKKISETL